MAPTSFEEFAAHIEESVTSFQVAAPAWFLFARTFDGGEGSRAFTEHWLPDEQRWIATNRPAHCYARRYTAWAKAVAGIVDAMRRAGTGNGLEMNPDFPDLWADRSSVVAAFEPTSDYECTPVTSAKFTDHVRASLTTFTPAATALYYWITYLDYAPPGPDSLGRNWIPDEARWLVTHDPLPCLSERWQAWGDAIAEVRAASVDLRPIGGSSAGALDRYSAAREAVERFDPEANVSEPC